MQIDECIVRMDSNEGQRYLTKLYGCDDSLISLQKERYKNLMTEYKKVFKESEVEVFSSPGRTEISGNHTDHNCGKVLAGSVSLDCIAIASKNDENLIRIHDITYKDDFTINVNKTDKKPDEMGSMALVRGIIAGVKKFGFNVGGINLCLTTNVISAAGVSSSASFEMLICKVIDTLYNDSKMRKIDCARIGQFAENVYWDKKSGLMDQTACAVGGVLYIDFKDTKNPILDKIDFDISKKDYNLLLVNTGGNHADLSEEYSAIPNEMFDVAKEFGKRTLREVPFEKFLENIENVRCKVGDRAVLRAIHYFDENTRVQKQVEALKDNNFKGFLENVGKSGDSSWKLLQNCYTTQSSKDQSTAYYLALTQMFLNGREGACRVHGGGFGGTIVVYLPNDSIDDYVSHIERLTGNKSMFKMSIRKYGAVSFNELLDSI